MIKRYKIEALIAVEQGCEEYIYESINDGMDFEENERIIDYHIEEYIEKEMTQEDKDKIFQIASQIYVGIMVNKNYPVDPEVITKNSINWATTFVNQL